MRFEEIHSQVMRMDTLEQTIQSLHFSVLVKYDHIPSLPALAIFAEEPFLHNHVGVHPKIPRAFEDPVFSAISV